MTKKRISKKTKSDLREISEVTKRLAADKSEVDHELAIGNEKALDLICDVPPWAYFYSLSFAALVAFFLDCLGYKEKLLELVGTEGKEEANMTIVRQMVSDAEDEELFEEFMQLEREDRAVVLSLVFALMGNIEALKRFGISLCEMVARAPHDQQMLLKAVAIDRTVVANPIIAREIGLASLRQDESFMNKLAKAITRSISLPEPKLDETRLMIEILDEVAGLESISYEQVAEILINDLAVHPGDGKDPESAIKKMLQRRKLAKGT